MYPIDIRGTGIVSHCVARLCQRSGFHDLALQPYDPEQSVPEPPALTLGANQTRILAALGLQNALYEVAHRPDREQVRLARSRYLVAEMPLGQFYQDRYGAAMINLTRAELSDLVKTSLPANSTDATTSTTTQRQASLTIETEAPLEADGPWRLDYVELPATHTIANVTWLARNAVAWQFSSRNADHLYLLRSANSPLDENDWHGSLWALLEAVEPVHQVQASNQVRQHWVAGDWVFVGQACLPYHAMRRETWFTGLEDAWVLSRMLENYEEAMHEGLASFETYRKPRAERIARHNDALLKETLRTSAAARTMRNIGIGLRNRFLPEIAMQRIDWLYGYDCIRGFH
ncbi:MAG: hypothetical protein RJQ07_10855 [Pseudomonadales bacterium]